MRTTLVTGAFFLAVTMCYGRIADASDLTTVCRFTSGPRLGSAVDYKPYGVQAITVGSPCTDGQGSFGVAVTSTPPAFHEPTGGSAPTLFRPGLSSGGLEGLSGGGLDGIEAGTPLPTSPCIPFPILCGK